MSLHNIKKTKNKKTFDSQSFEFKYKTLIFIKIGGMGFITDGDGVGDFDRGFGIFSNLLDTMALFADYFSDLSRRDNDPEYNICSSLPFCGGCFTTVKIVTPALGCHREDV